MLEKLIPKLILWPYFTLTKNFIVMQMTSFRKKLYYIQYMTIYTLYSIIYCCDHYETASLVLPDLRDKYI